MPKPSADKIKLADLKQRARAGSLKEAELKRYFALDEKKTKAFKPVLQLDSRHVDTGGEKLTAQEVAELFDLAATAAKQTRPTHGGPTALVARTRILVEGDSWFNLPDFFFPKDAVDFLREKFDVSSIALFGDTVDNMLVRKQYVQKLKAGNFRHFLFSGGGNDVLGSIRKFVTERRPGDTDPAHAPDYVKPAFQAKIDTIMKGYRTLVADVRAAVGNKATIYVHGYGNAFPLPSGDYLGAPLAKLGFDPVAHDRLSAAIVAHMVAMFNKALMVFAATHANVVYIDLRDAMKNKADWNGDEIHPKASGARKIAAVLGDAIRANVPVA